MLEEFIPGDMGEASDLGSKEIGKRVEYWCTIIGPVE
jgi:hypothetical protein